MDIPPPPMGEGEGGGGQDQDLWVPPPLHPLPPRGGEIFSNYVFSIMDSLVIDQKVQPTGLIFQKYVK